MNSQNKAPESNGLRLLHLINTRSLDIARRESRNTGRMCLYGTGGCWTGFESSAYFLSRLFPGLESFVVSHPEYPFAIVGVSVPERDVKRYMRHHTALRKKDDYLEFSAAPFAPLEYGAWHNSKVEELKEK